jgi:hypothetical protein
MAGSLAVMLHQRLLELKWLTASPVRQGTYEVTPSGVSAFADLGMDIAAIRTQRRRFACDCLDWSERRPHLAGALGAALLHSLVRRKWVIKDLDGRALRITPAGRRALSARFDLEN